MVHFIKSTDIVNIAKLKAVEQAKTHNEFDEYNFGISHKLLYSLYLFELMRDKLGSIPKAELDKELLSYIFQNE